MGYDIDVHYSSYNKKFTFNVNQKEYDISNEVPDEVWNMTGGIFPTNPVADQKIRKRIA
jgi:hypothetical protein